MYSWDTGSEFTVYVIWERAKMIKLPTLDEDGCTLCAYTVDSHVETREEYWVSVWLYVCLHYSLWFCLLLSTEISGFQLVWQEILRSPDPKAGVQIYMATMTFMCVLGIWPQKFILPWSHTSTELSFNVTVIFKMTCSSCSVWLSKSIL